MYYYYTFLYVYGIKLHTNWLHRQGHSRRQSTTSDIIHRWPDEGAYKCKDMVSWWYIQGGTTTIHPDVFYSCVPDIWWQHEASSISLLFYV